MRWVYFVALVAAPALAQVPTPATEPPPGIVCDTQVVTSIQITPQPPAMIARSTSGFRRALLHALFQSATTDEGIVESFLLISPGDRCSPKRLAEVERVLRSQPFIGSATVRAVPDTGNGVRLEVETLDEIPLIVGGRWRNGLSGATFGNGNLFGQGLHVVARWNEGNFFRDGVALQVRKYGLLGGPLVLSLDAERKTLGQELSVSLGRPFLSNLQLIGWHLGAQRIESYQPFVRPDDPTLSLELERTMWSAGAVTRVGGRSIGALAGPVVMYDRAVPAPDAVVISDSGFLAAGTDELRDRYDAYTSFRAGAAVGIRLLNYHTVSALDALLAPQDVARGFQAGVIAARGLEAFGAKDLDDFVSLDLYSGIGGARSFGALRLRGEGQRAREGGEWSALVASGRAALYVKPSERRTVMLSGEFSGAWREKLPMQLSLGQVGGGPRGYEGSPIANGRRLVVRLEERAAIGRLGRYGHWGLAAYVDGARAWASTAPYGEDIDGRVSVGLGLLAAVPSQSRRLLRVDVAVPVTSGAQERFRVRVAAFDPTRVFWREPGDVARARAGSAPTAIFGWP